MKLIQGVILGFLGQTRDRFATYQQPRSEEEKLALAASIPGVSCVEVVYPYETQRPDDLLAAVHRHGLSFASVNANIKGEAQFAAGSVSRHALPVRARAVEIIKAAKDMAIQLGAPLVTCCPLTDGWDYLFQADYATAWKHMVESFAEAASYRPEVPLYVEYKYSEARVNCLLDSAATAIHLCRDAATPGMGITIDFGHALYAGENPARSLCMVAGAQLPFYLHTNDNDGRFDWDLAGASRNLLAYAEFLFYAREYGYDKCMTTDASPRTLDAVAMFTRHISLTASLWDLIDRIDRPAWLRLMREEKFERLQELVQTEIYRL
jgi:xylose isomerase